MPASILTYEMKGKQCFPNKYTVISCILLESSSVGEKKLRVLISYNQRKN